MTYKFPTSVPPDLSAINNTDIKGTHPNEFCLIQS